MTRQVTRREFVATAAAISSAALWPGAADAAPASPRSSSPLTVLFQGDSITDAGRNRGNAQPNVAGALGTGYPLLIAAAELASHPERDLRFFNRGVSGDKVPDLQARWTGDALDLKPDVLSVLVGVNDFWHKLLRGYTGTIQDYEDQYTALLQQTRQALPSVRLVVLEPFVLRTGAVDEHWFPEFDQRRAAAARVARRAGAAFIPLQNAFDRAAARSSPQHWAADGVHPTPAGHQMIADLWRRVVKLGS